MKAMTLRLDPERAAMLEMVARADDRSLNDTVRDAIDTHIEKRRADVAFQDRLQNILREDREILERLAK